MGIRVTGEKPTLKELHALEDALFGTPAQPGAQTLAFSSDLLEKLLADSTAIMVSAFDEESRTYVGYAAGIPASLIPLPARERTITSPNALYLMTLGVLEEFRNQGIGQRLIDERKRRALQQRYRIGAGHFREGSSAHLARKNLIVAHEFPCHDYAKTSETFYYIVGELRTE